MFRALCAAEAWAPGDDIFTRWVHSFVLTCETHQMEASPTARQTNNLNLHQHRVCNKSTEFEQLNSAPSLTTKEPFSWSHNSSVDRDEIRVQKAADIDFNRTALEPMSRIIKNEQRLFQR